MRLLDRVLEELDYSKLCRSYSSTGRNPSVSPKRLFKIMVYAYSQGLYSTRKIEEACRLNLAFQYLLRGDPIPDHNTLTRFRRDRLEGCIEDLLTQLVEWLSAHGEISFEHLFVDGTKVVYYGAAEPPFRRTLSHRSVKRAPLPARGTLNTAPELIAPRDRDF